LSGLLMQKYGKKNGKSEANGKAKNEEKNTVIKE
jgi:hypothetical protein